MLFMDIGFIEIKQMILKQKLPDFSDIGNDDKSGSVLDVRRSFRSAIEKQQQRGVIQEYLHALNSILSRLGDISITDIRSWSVQSHSVIL